MYPLQIAPRLRSLAVVVALSGSLGIALGATGAVAAATKAGHFPVTVRLANGVVTIPARPTRIISLSPTATEDLFAVGAGHQVIAVDNDSTYPRSAPVSALSGYTPNIEAIAHYNPDLVVVSGNEGGVIAALGRLHIPVAEEPATTTISGAYGEIASLGALTGNQAAAQRLISTMRARIAAVVAAVPVATRHLSYYVELDQTYYSATSATFLGQIFSLFGLRNIADAASGAATGYPQLSSEYIVAKNPRLIFLADTLCCGQSVTTVRSRAGWSTMSAVAKGNVIGLNDDIASRWGPRIVVLAQQIERALLHLSQQG